MLCVSWFGTVISPSEPDRSTVLSMVAGQQQKGVAVLPIPKRLLAKLDVVEGDRGRNSSGRVSSL